MCQIIFPPWRAPRIKRLSVTVGWRWFRITRNRRFGSLYSDEVYTVGEWKRAGCRSIFTNIRRTANHIRRCKCGIYVYKTREQALDDPPGPDAHRLGFVLRRVLVRGRAVVGKNGWRVDECKIIHLREGS